MAISFYKSSFSLFRNLQWVVVMHLAIKNVYKYVDTNALTTSAVCGLMGLPY